MHKLQINTLPSQRFSHDAKPPAQRRNNAQTFTSLAYSDQWFRMMLAQILSEVNKCATSDY